MSNILKIVSLIFLVIVIIALVDSTYEPHKCPTDPFTFKDAGKILAFFIFIWFLGYGSAKEDKL